MDSFQSNRYVRAVNIFLQTLLIIILFAGINYLGMKYFERKGDSFNSENDFDTTNAKFKASFRGSWGCTDKRSIFGSPGA